MKKLYLIISFVFICTLANAQTEQPMDHEQRGQNIEALKIAFISKELNLTPQEAEKFWPLYNQYSTELKAAFKDNHNIIERDENVLNIRKRYNGQFIKIIGPERTNNLFGAELRFRQLLIKAMRRQERMQNRPDHSSQPEN
jgi:hypothetical protein